MTSPKGAVSPRRLNVTPALMADVRRRYEASEETLATLAADLGCSVETVRNIAKRELWVRYVPPPRDLTAAARLRIKAEALAQEQEQEQEQEQGAAHQSPFVPAQAGTQEQDGNADVVAPGSPRSRGRTDDDEDAAPPDIAETAEQLHRELQALIAEVQATRQRMKREGYGKRDLQDVSRMILSLSGALGKLKPLLHPAQHAGNDDAYDDIPTDIDAFREALAQKIEAFMESRGDEIDDTEDDDAGDDVA